MNQAFGSFNRPQQRLPSVRVSLLRRLSFWSLIPITIAAIWVTAAPPYSLSPSIRSDGLGYYAWTQAIVDGNFDFCSWWPLDTVGAISARSKSHPNRCEDKYTPGMALLRFPVMGPINALEDDGNAGVLEISGSEYKASLWLGALALLTAVSLIFLTLRRLRVGSLVANLVVLGACAGTGLFHYGTFDSSFTEVYSAALFAGLLLAGVSAAQRKRPPNAFLTFGLVFFIALVREPDVLPLLVVVGAWMRWYVRELPKADRLRAAARASIPVFLALAVVGGFQLLYNHWSSGMWTLNSYGQQPFSLGYLKELDVLLAYQHGLFVWYPVVAVFLAAALCKRASRQWCYVSLAAIATLDVIYGSWSQWSLGGAFGMRGFVDIVPLFAVAGGVGIATLNVRARVLVLCVAALCTIGTVELMVGYWREQIPDGAIPASQFWGRVVGNHSLLG
jgi:hypothetical protein